jgi:hypothetical protein
MGKHEAAEAKKSVAHHLARHALHPVVHIVTLVSLHVAALVVVEKTPLLSLLLIH